MKGMMLKIKQHDVWKSNQRTRVLDAIGKLASREQAMFPLRSNGLR
jgi:hypothetical protein